MESHKDIIREYFQLRGEGGGGTESLDLISLELIPLSVARGRFIRRVVVLYNTSESRNKFRSLSSSFLDEYQLN